MKYFLTGGTGFIGSHVARQLVQAGHGVTAIVRDPAKAADLASAGIALHRGDVTDRDSMRIPMTGVDGVFHIAGWYKLGVRDTTPALHVNVDGTRNVLELMRELGIPKGVYTSTLAVFSDTQGRVVDESYRFTGRHVSVYDASKAAAHYDVAGSLIRKGLPLVIVQPGLVYGPGDTSMVQQTLRKYLRRKLPMIPRRTAFCWAHVDDIARAHILAMERGTPGESYIVGGEPCSFEDALRLAESITGVPAPHVHVRPGVLKALAGVMSVIERIVPVPEDYSSEFLRVNAGVTYLGSDAKARTNLGYAPRALQEGLAETLRYEQSLLDTKP